MEYLPLSVIAEALGRSHRAVEIGVARVASGKSKTYLGAALVIRTIKGRGGRAGVQYQVRRDSLSSDLQGRLKASPKESQRLRRGSCPVTWCNCGLGHR